MGRCPIPHRSSVKVPGSYVKVEAEKPPERPQIDFSPPRLCIPWDFAESGLWAPHGRCRGVHSALSLVESANTLTFEPVAMPGCVFRGREKRLP